MINELMKQYHQDWYEVYKDKKNSWCTSKLKRSCRLS
jgi:hypothetical protein